MGKINGKVILVFIFWLLVIGILIYSRFVNLGWGLPYPMHPDERNMVTAIQQLSCQPPIVKLNLPRSMFGNWEPVTSWLKIIKPFDLFNCFNPRFFAYGQFPLYLGYLVTYFLKFFDGDMGFPITFQEAALSLRIISALASIINVYILLKIVGLFYNQKSKSSNFTFDLALFTLIFTLSPYAIQFSHFGTTESLLMLFYSTIIYFSLLFVDKEIPILSFVGRSAIFIGLSLATKVSSLIFAIVPFLVLLFNKDPFKLKTSISTSKNSVIFFIYKIVSRIIDLSTMIWVSLLAFIIFSPHNLINLNEFLGSMNYESDVALGKSIVFYTRQFVDTKPFYFQLVKVFPYALSWTTYILGSLWMITASWRDKKNNLLRFAFLIYFVPSAMIYAKWSRFMAPVFPLFTIFAILFILNIKDQILKIKIKYQKFYILIYNISFCVLIFAIIIPGLAYIRIYQTDDVRFQASEWIYKNISDNSYILSETANVVDVPFSNGTMEQSNNYNVISFNFYDLDEDTFLQDELIDHLKKAEYIFMPSRRIFANHMNKQYPILNKYYEDLFSGKLGFEKVAEFNSFPKICLPMTDKCLIFDDERSEETWTVFDHPVIRIYKRVSEN
jgi:hypothetical protein